MIELILKLLKYANETDSENIAIAKGKNKMPETWNELKSTVKRMRNGNR